VTFFGETQSSPNWQIALSGPSLHIHLDTAQNYKRRQTIVSIFILNSLCCLLLTPSCSHKLLIMRSKSRSAFQMLQITKTGKLSISLGQIIKATCGSGSFPSQRS